MLTVIALIALAVFVPTVVVLTLRVVARDGYRQQPTDWSRLP
ncbi:hypothetical protein [Microbacterium sp. No. 7]|nr:hypothetical protein [Microbacterium sp. No. 7]